MEACSLQEGCHQARSFIFLISQFAEIKDIVIEQGNGLRMRVKIIIALVFEVVCGCLAHPACSNRLLLSSFGCRLFQHGPDAGWHFLHRLQHLLDPARIYAFRFFVVDLLIIRDEGWIAHHARIA